MSGDILQCDNLGFEINIEFIKFIAGFIKQLGCTIESDGENRYLIKKSGLETGVLLEFLSGMISSVAVLVKVKKEASLPFNDKRFYKHAVDEDDIPLVIAPFDDPREIGVLLELICKGIYFNNSELRTWHCTDCDKEGVEVFLQDGSVTTIDGDDRMFHLVITRDKEKNGAIYDELIEQYVLALCHECFQVRGYSTD